ncbi:MAG: EAL domain-containing protein [Planctomycetes bacterium]|nr:EAL domain-containing protein [Planctomycetota bacterium]
MVCRRVTFAAAAEWPNDALLFLNCSPPVFGGATFLDLIADDLKRVDGLDSRRIVLEITERADHGEFDNLDLRSLELRELGYQIALDDVGAGTSGLNRIMSLRPNWLKLDIELISGIDVDPFKQNLIRIAIGPQAGAML